MIRQSTIMSLCEEAGVDPNYVCSAQIKPNEVNFVMYSQDMLGNKYIDKQTRWVKTYWVKAQIDYS